MPQVQHNSFSEVGDGIYPRMNLLIEKLGLHALDTEPALGTQLHGDAWKDILGRVLIEDNVVSTSRFIPKYIMFMNPTPKTLCKIPEMNKDFTFADTQQVNTSDIKVMLPACFNSSKRYKEGDVVTVALEAEMCREMIYPDARERSVKVHHKVVTQSKSSSLSEITPNNIIVCAFKTEFLVTKVFKIAPEDPHNFWSIYWDYYEVKCLDDEFIERRFILPAGLLCETLELIPHLI